MYSARTRHHLARCLADAFLAGAWDPAALADRGGAVLDPRPRWLRPLSSEVVGAYHRPPADRPRELAAFIELALRRRRAPSRGARAPRVTRWILADLAMGSRRWPVPSLGSPADVAAFLDVEPGQLDWLADRRGLERTVADERLRHYRYEARPRRDAPPRVIECPKQRLKAIQRRLLREILDQIPAHPAAHGFVAGRSARTHAEAHLGREAVLRLDLEDFFASVPAGRVFGILGAAGYPESVAHLLTALMTNVVSLAAWNAIPRPSARHLIPGHHGLGRRLATPHLPQGAPTSPALANLAAHRLDRRLTGLAAACGLSYTRYADDLTFSGDRAALLAADRFQAAVARIARDEGFAVNHRKTALMPRARRQHVCGIVVNERPNVARGDYDALRAVLHDAAHNGPAAANRHAVADFRAHLLGRIAWVAALNPAREDKLTRAFEAIDWRPAADPR